MDAPPSNAGDIEKGQSKLVVNGSSPDATATGSINENHVVSQNRILGYFHSLIQSEITESRGIERVGVEERHEVPSIPHYSRYDTCLIWSTGQRIRIHADVSVMVFCQSDSKQSCSWPTRTFCLCLVFPRLSTLHRFRLPHWLLVHSLHGDFWTCIRKPYYGAWQSYL